MVDALLGAGARPAGPPPPPAPLGALTAHLGLGDEAEAALLILLAPEIDPRYWTFYAYLNDEAARRWPTSDLVGRLLGAPAEPLFVPSSPIVRLGLAVPSDAADGARPVRLRGWRAAPALVHRALGLPDQHAPWLRACAAEPAAAPLPLQPPWPALLACGLPGSGRTALVAGHAAAAGLGALVFDAAEAGEDRALRLGEAAAAARLDRAMLIVAGDRVEPFPCPVEDVALAVTAPVAGG